MEKREQFLLFFTIFCYLLLDHVKSGTGFSLRDKQLFEISGRDNESQPYVLSEKITRDISCVVSARQTIDLTCQAFFPDK